MSQFSWILCIRDVDNAEELSGKDLLSTDSVHKERKEAIALKKERDEMVERRYTAKRQKLRDLLKYTHLVNNDIQFSPRAQGKCVFIISYVVPANKMCPHYVPFLGLHSWLLLSCGVSVDVCSML